MVMSPPYYSPWDQLLDSLAALPLYWIPGALVAIFIYHDSTKRNESYGLFWAIAAFFLWPIVLLIYLLYHHLHKEPSAMAGQKVEGGRKTYFYFASFVTLFILFWALADLGRIILSHLWIPYLKSVYVLDSFKQGVSFRFATVLVTLPLWVFHWLKALEPPLNPTERGQKRNYTLTVFGITSFSVLIFGIALLYQVFNLLLGVSTAQLHNLAAPLSYFFTSLVTWFHHLQVFKDTELQHKGGT